MQDRFKFKYLYQNKLREVIDLDFGNEYITVRISPHGTATIGLEWKNLIQCTGLKDKNDKLIYEGDIVKNPNFCKFDTYIISYDWGEYFCNINGHYGCGYSIQVLTEHHNSIEVIGNIYENPELLETEQ